jgi:hypothetical protein
MPAGPSWKPCPGAGNTWPNLGCVQRSTSSSLGSNSNTSALREPAMNTCPSVKAGTAASCPPSGPVSSPPPSASTGPSVPTSASGHDASRFVPPLPPVPPVPPAPPMPALPPLPSGVPASGLPPGLSASSLPEQAPQRSATRAIQGVFPTDILEPPASKVTPRSQGTTEERVPVSRNLPRTWPLGFCEVTALLPSESGGPLGHA